VRNIDREVENFVKSIQDMWKEEPLDGDGTEEITKKVLAELDFQNGNVGEEALDVNKMKEED